MDSKGFFVLFVLSVSLVRFVLLVLLVLLVLFVLCLFFAFANLYTNRTSKPTRWISIIHMQAL